MKQTIIIWLLVALGLTIGMLVEISSSEPHLGRIQGQVTDAVTGNSIAQATVSVSPSDRTTVTGVDGRFVFDQLVPGTYQIQIVCAGYATVVRESVVVVTGSPTIVNLALQPDTARTPRKEEKGLLGKLKDYLSRENDARPVPSVAAPSIVRSGTDQGAASTGVAETDAYKSQSSFQQNCPPSVRRPVPHYDYEYQPLPPFDMNFHDFGTNGFVDSRRDRFSTFGADIDDASYTLVRRYLNEGNIPPSDAVRVEEFVNHFDYGYNPPEEGKFRIFSELAESPFDRNVSYLKIGIKGREVPESRRKPIVLTVVIDVSGSMGYDNRFEVVKESMRLLTERLDSRDRIAIVVYGSFATLVLPSTSGDNREQIMNAVNGLYPGGSTFAEAGLRLGYETANRQYTEGYNNLVILLSDGVANVGRTSPDAIMGQIRQFARKGLTLSTFGYGMGNYNDVLLEKLAKEGNGSYAYVDTYDQARALFADRLVSTVQTLARDVKIQVEFNPSTVSSYRLLGYEKRAIPDQNFRDNKQDGGEIKAGHEVTALYELVLNRRCEDSHVATVNVRWKNLAQDEVTEVSQEVNLAGGLVRFESARPEFRLAVVASRFAETLKQTRHADGSLDRLIAIARRISYDRANDDTRELVSLMERAKSLSAGYGRYEDD
jgi:Ca-activated chloride channel homolog